MKVEDLFDGLVLSEPELSARRKAALKRKAERDHQEFLRKRNFSTNVDALKAKIEPKQTITLGGHAPSTVIGTGRPHGKVR